MLTVLDDIKLKELRQEWESAELIANAFPKRLDFRKLADSLQILIISKESDSRYV